MTTLPPPKPGTCRLTQNGTWLWLTLTTSPGQTWTYQVEQIGGDYLLSYLDEDHKGHQYRITTGWRDGAWRCNCPDSQHRNRACKHARALKAALVAQPF